jgi:hypothetical protein
MKKQLQYIVALLLLFNLGNEYYTQCDNNVSTNPANPTNNALPDVWQAVPTPPYNPDTRYLNGLDWWNATTYTLTDMWYNPTQPYGSMVNIQSSSLPSYYSYLVKGTNGAPVMSPQNGWELLLVNLGRYPDNVNVHNYIEHNHVPYMVFYNKYSGIIRVFVKYGYNERPTNSVDGVKINLYYHIENNPSNLSGILRLGYGVDRTLDQNTISYHLTAIAKPAGGQQYWMSADFQVTYDPCVCTFPTDLKLDFEFFSHTDFKLYGRGITVEEDLVDGSGNIIEQDFLGGVDFTSQNEAENGFIIYKKMDKLADDYIAKLEAYKTQLALTNEINDQLENDLLVLKGFRTIVKLGMIAFTGSPEFALIAVKLPHLLFSDDSKKNKEKFYREVEKILGKKLDTYQSDNFKKKSTPTKPVMPSVSFSEMNFSGVLEDELLINGPKFSTPGSFKNNPSVYDFPDGNNVYSYPVYNNPLGVFALLEAPKIIMSEVTYVAQNYQTSIPTYPYSAIKYDMKNQYQFKLNSDLKYAFNEAVDIQSYTIDASFIIKSNNRNNDGGTRLFTPQTSLNVPVNLISTDVSLNLESQEINTYNNDSILNISQSINKTTITYNTPYIPINAFKEYVAEVGIASECYFLSIPAEHFETNYQLIKGYEWQDFEIELKLLINVTYAGINSDNDPIEQTYIYTYVVDEGNITLSGTELVTDLATSSDHVMEYRENIYIGATHFDGTSIEGFILSGNNYTCKVWNDITIEGNLTTANGYTVNIKAGKEIEVVNNSEISPEITLSIESVLDYSSPMPEATSAYVSNFCQGLNRNAPSYQANVPRNYRPIENPEEENSEEEKPFTALNFNLYPNPTKDAATVSYNVTEFAEVTIQVTDLMGRIVLQPQLPTMQDAGNYEVQMNTSSLSKGIYLCSVKVGNQIKTKHLIIQ